MMLEFQRDWRLLQRGAELVRTVKILVGVAVLSLLASACDNEAEWERLNLETDCFVVEVSPEAGDDDDSAGDDDDSAGDDDDSAGDDDDSVAANDGAGQEILLVARPGLFADDLLGNAWLSPASGPAGTRFLVTVVLANNGQETGNPVDAVDRISVLAENGDLTATEFDMEASPADESRWTLTIAAGGDPESTVREDRLCLAVYAEIE